MALVIGIKYGKLLYCHGVVEENMDKKISTLEYNNRTVYDWFNHPFTADFGSPDIHLPLKTIYDIPLPPRIKETDIPQICSQLPYLLPLKILFVLWPPLLIRQIYLLLMILILSMLWRNMRLTVAEWKEDTVVRNMVEKYDTKRQGSIAPHALMKTRDYIIVVGFPG